MEAEYVKKSAAIVSAIICLAVGFFGGIIFSTYWEGGSNVRKMRVRDTSPAVRLPVQSTAQSPVQSPATSTNGNILSLKQEVAVNPNNAEAWAMLGHAYFDRNLHVEAIAAYKKYLELNPDNANVWTDLGVMYRRNGKPQDAIRCFDKAIEFNPQHHQSRFNKGIVLMFDLKDREAALNSWRELLKLDPAAKTPDGRPLKELINQYSRK